MFKKYFIMVTVVMMTLMMSVTTFAKVRENKTETYGEKFVKKLEKDLKSNGGSPKVDIRLFEDDDEITVYSDYTNKEYNYTEMCKFVIEGNEVSMTGFGRIGLDQKIKIKCEATVDRDEMLSDDTTIPVYIGMKSDKVQFNK